MWACAFRPAERTLEVRSWSPTSSGTGSMEASWMDGERAALVRIAGQGDGARGRNARRRSPVGSVPCCCPASRSRCRCRRRWLRGRGRHRATCQCFRPRISASPVTATCATSPAPTCRSGTPGAGRRGVKACQQVRRGVSTKCEKACQQVRGDFRIVNEYGGGDRVFRAPPVFSRLFPEEREGRDGAKPAPLARSGSAVRRRR